MVPMHLQRILGTAGLVLAPLPTLFYVSRQANALPEDSPQRFVRRPWPSWCKGFSGAEALRCDRGGALADRAPVRRPDGDSAPRRRPRVLLVAAPLSPHGAVAPARP